MSDPFAKVTPGQRLAALPAEAWNAFIDAAQAHRRRLAADPGQAMPAINDGQIIRVKNTTASDLPRFSVLGISAPIFPPEEASPATLNEIAFAGVAPVAADHAGGRVAITLAPIAAGEIGPAQVDGVCLCKLTGDKPAAEVRFADVITDGVTASLGIADAGLQVLWIAPSGDPRWAMIRLGGGGAGGDASQCFVVKSIENDYLVCRTWNGDSEGSTDVNIAKPWLLQHKAERYPQITGPFGFSTIDEQTAEATVDGDTYTWKVSPPYAPGAIIQAAQRITGVFVDDVELPLMSINDKRSWCEVTEIY